MKSRTGILTLVGLIALGGLFYGLTRSEPHAAKTMPEDQSVETAPRPISSGTSANLLTLRSMIANPIQKNPRSVAKFSEECSRLENLLFELSLKEIEHATKMKKLPDPTGCSASDPKIAKILKYYSNACAGAINAVPGTEPPAVKSGEKLADCEFATIVLRSSLAAAERGEKPLKEIEDMRELADLLIASFGLFLTDFSALRMKEMTAVADRMAEIDPRLQVAVKAGVMSETLKSVLNKEALNKGDTQAEAPNWDDLQKRLARAEELSPDDSELTTLRRVIETEGMDPERVKQDSLNRVSKNPNDWREQQILAWANFKQGRRDEARAALQQALRANPGNRDLKENLAVVNRRDSKPDDFKIAIKVGINFNGLLN